MEKVSLEDICKSKNREVIDARELLRNDEELFAHYEDFYKRHSDDENPDSSIWAHGASNDGEIVLLRFNPDTGFHLASLHLPTRKESEFVITEQEPIGASDKAEILLTAEVEDLTTYLLLSRHGSQWKSGDAPSSYLGDMRLVIPHADHRKSPS